MVEPAATASRLLAAEGISAGVLDARFIKPLDRDLIIDRASAAGKVIVVEEGALAGGFGSAVLELFSEEGIYNIKVDRMGIPDYFVEHGTRSELLADLGLNAAGIADRARAMLEGRPVSKIRRLSSMRH